MVILKSINEIEFIAVTSELVIDLKPWKTKANCINLKLHFCYRDYFNKLLRKVLLFLF